MFSQLSFRNIYLGSIQTSSILKIAYLFNSLLENDTYWLGFGADLRIEDK